MDTGGKHCYPGTNILRNKYDIQDSELLEKLEVQKVMIKLLSLDIRPSQIPKPCDIHYLIHLHYFLFGDLYEWAGTFREESLYKSERILSGASVEYCQPHEISEKLDQFFIKSKNINWKKITDLSEKACDFLCELWTIHPFREGNTRTCITFLWQYFIEHNVFFNVELFRKNPMYVRDALVMYSYDEKKYLKMIMKDALSQEENHEFALLNEEPTKEYQISKDAYHAFKNKYSIKK